MNVPDTGVRGHSPSTILVVEDSLTQAAQLRHMLEQAGYRVMVASHGDGALADIAREMPDLVITDINMSGVDGYALCRRIKDDATTAATPVMLLTTLSDPLDVMRGLECGADNFTVKPYEPKALLSRIAHMLANRDLRDVERNSIGIAVNFAGRKFFVNSDRLQILNLLLSTYETAVQQKSELVRVQAKLNEWNDQLEQKIRDRTAALSREIGERRHTEGSLRESEERFRSAMHYTSIGMALASPEGRWLEVNPAFCAIVGYSDTELLEKTFQSLTHPEDLELSLDRVRRLLAGDMKFYSVEKRYLHKDGHPIWVNLNVSLVREANGSPRYFIAQIQDITVRVKAQDTLRLNEESLRLALENLDMVLFRQDAELRYTWVHRSELSRGGPADMVGKTDAEIMPAADAARIMELKRAVMETGVPRRNIVSITSRTQILYYDLVAAPLRDERGRIVGVTGSSLDITERVQMEQAREQSEALFRGVLEAAPDAIIIVDAAGTIVLTNAAAVTMFGHTHPDALVGQSVEDLIPIELRKRHAQQRVAYSTEFQDRRMGANRRLDGLRADGSVFPVEIGLSPLMLSDSRFVVAIARDVSERRVLEQQLQQSQKMEAIGQLTGGMAHDFNNLLGVILGNLDILEQMLAGNERVLKRVATAQKAAVRGADLTRRLLAFSRRQQLNPEPSSVNDAIRNTVEMATRTLGPEIRISMDLVELPPVLVDAAGLENVLLNLAINSRDAMPGGGDLCFASKPVQLDGQYPAVLAGEITPGEYACVSVSDSGEGMSHEILERALEPFFTTKPRGKGTGLGLSMVYGFIKQSRGHLNLYSELDHGTRVTLYLPFAETHDVSQKKDGLLPAIVEGGKTVLVVDDEVDLLEVAVSYLEEMGFRVLHATDGPSALDIAMREPDLDLLLTDVVMPGSMGGAQLSHKLRELKPDIRIVYSTGFSSNALNERNGLQLDSIVLAKPYRRREFAAAIHRAFSQNLSIPENNNNE